MTSLKVNEIFHSIQGESTQAGRPCTFVRLTACDLRCSWCDTEYAFHEGKSMEFAEIMTSIRELVPATSSPGLVEITGGEPLLQKQTPALCRELLSAGYEVLVETGGHRDVSVLPPEVKVIMDLKCPGSGESHKNRWDNLESLPHGSEIKFVLGDRPDYDWACAIVEEHNLSTRYTVLFSPVHGALPYQQLAEWILEDGVDVRFQAQLHKHIWEPTRRGV